MIINIIITAYYHVIIYMIMSGSFGAGINDFHLLWTEAIYGMSPSKVEPEDITPEITYDFSTENL